MYINELLRELGVPEKDLSDEVTLANEKTRVFSGVSRDGYHGYRASYKMYDPYDQLTPCRKDTTDQYAFAERVTFVYKGERPAAVSYFESDVASNTNDAGIYLFLPAGMEQEIIFKAQEKEPIRYTVPPKLLQKWIEQVSEQEHRDPKRWYEYDRVQRKVWRKARAYAAYTFARKHPNEVGVVKVLYSGYGVRDRGQIYTYGRSILVQNGVVEFVDLEDAQPDILLAKYGVKYFHPIEINE